MIPSPFHGIFSSSLNAGGDSHPPKRTKELFQVKSLIKKEENSKPVKTVGQVALDVFEFDNYYILKAPIAGVKLSDLDIEITDNVITIRGHRHQMDDIPDSQYYVRECFWGGFERSVTLPFNIDPRKVKATFNKECILKILVPKEERVKIIRINE
jgi:HSP20 family protein